MTTTNHCLSQCLINTERLPEHTAFITDDQSFSYAELAQYIAATVSYLRELGITSKDRVILLCDQAVNQVLIFHALSVMGCQIMLHSPIHHEQDWRFLAQHTLAQWAITQYLPKNKQWGKQLHVIPLQSKHSQPEALSEHTAIYSYQGLTKSSDLSPLALASCHANDMAMVIYTSGSTGKPKGVMLSHQNIITARDAILQYLGMNHHHTVLSSLPFWFDYGLYQSLLAFACGATLIQIKPMVHIQSLLDLASLHRATTLPITPNTAALLANRPRQYEPSHCDSVLTITTTGSALLPHHVNTLKQCFPNANIVAMYGLTECKRCAYLPTDQLNAIMQKPPTDPPTERKVTIPIGRAIPGTTMRLLRKGKTIKNPNEVGEVVITGEHIMLGYWRDPESTSQAIQTDPRTGIRQLHTGDLGILDAGGEIHLIGRKDEVFKCRSERISPKFIEECLNEAYKSVEFCIFGLPDGFGDNLIIVYLTTNNATLEAIKWHARTRLPPSHQPHVWCALSKLPRNSNGKIDRKTLMAQHRAFMGHPPKMMT